MRRLCEEFEHTLNEKYQNKQRYNKMGRMDKIEQNRKINKRI